MPKPGSGRGFEAMAYVSRLVLMLNGGGRSLEDLRTLKSDTAVASLLKQGTLRSTDAFGDWLRRTGVLERVWPAWIAWDASQIVAEKQAAQFTCKGEQGYMPMIGHLAEAAVVVFDEFREGNIAPATGKLEFIQACEARLPKGHRIAHVRLDSAGYQAGIFNYCEDTGKSFAIGGRLDTPSLKVIGGNASRRTVPHHPRPQLRAGASDVPVAASRSSPPTTRRASMHAARLAQNLPIYPLRIAAAALARSRLLKIRFGIQFLVPRDPPPT